MMNGKLLIALLFFGLSEQSFAGDYKISGNIRNLTGKVYLMFMGSKTIDSAICKNGKFVLSGTLPEVDMAVLLAGDRKNRLARFFVEGTSMTLEGDAEDPANIVVKGSETDAFYRSEFPKYASGIDSMALYVRDFPASPSAAFVLGSSLAMRLPVAQIEKLIAGLSPEVRKSSYVEKVQQQIDRQKKVEVGQPYIDIVLPDTAGNTLALSRVIARGGYVLVDFWASWCGPCRAENPHVVEAYKRFKDKGFTVFGVSLDQPNGKDKWLGAIEKDGLTWDHVSDLKGWQSAAAADYVVHSIPQNVLISPQGKIVARNLRGAKLMETLEQIYAGDAPASADR